MHRQGAELAFTYQNDKLRKRVEEFAAQCGSDITLPLDVGDDAQIEAAFAALGQRWDGFDIVVHSVAFAPREELQGSFVDAVTREGFRQAHDISAYSLAALAKAARPMLRPGGALLALTYLGAVRVLPNYNVMGLAKASLEACIRYLAASMGAGRHPRQWHLGRADPHPGGVRHLRLPQHARLPRGAHAPLRRNVSIEDVGNVAAFLCSDLAAGVTGEITYVDGGYNIVGMGG